MSAPIARSSTAYTVPPTQNTAPVLEFRCLYTHDIRRKQKRWQDGVLRFHTFNRRIMVYDDTGGLIGDKHLKQEGFVAEGDELTLDRGALVEVGEALLTLQTDISPLFQRKNQGNATPEKTPTDVATASRVALTATSAASVQTAQPRHKSLNALLGPRKGLHGKAVLPTKSPYELRQEDRENVPEEHAAKRQKLQTHAPPKGHNAVTTNLTPKQKKHLPLWAKAADTRRAKPARDGVSSPVQGLVDITSDCDELHSDITIPPTPPAVQEVVPKLSRKAPMHPPQRPAPVSPPAHKEHHKSPTPDPLLIPQRENPDDLVQSRRKTQNNRREKIQDKTQEERLEPQRITKEAQNPEPQSKIHEQHRPDAQRKSQPKPLRIVKQAPRRMLLCADAPIRKSGMALELDAHDTVSEIVPSNKPRKKKKLTLADLDEEFANMEAEIRQSRLRPATQPNLTSKKGKGAAALTPDGKPHPPARNFRRVKSTNDAISVESEMLSGVDIEILDAPAQHAEPPAKRSKKSPLSKNKSLSTTDVGNTPVAKKSKLSKQPSSTGKKKKGEPKKDTDMGPWSTEAFDLFDWKPPRLATTANGGESSAGIVMVNG
ncbi:hypothetical protein NA57DRAFT_74716 [Rhizodiscina lignyota]|uniref:5'-3' DNA helicase ZGRF1-like N-terminal domain-containing protein n=1 Tax=Rhizodiscina lignyota TaxID=1504668 RepID=A0A9P4IKX6_9PEZI|nr:hypothetical protein NA57DRAFT_74716 [Rhizodiscina lignyota]